MNTTALFPRKRILNALGYSQNASRSSWSHDDGKRVFFDAWTNRYDADGRYPMCTPDAYQRPDENGEVSVDGEKELARRGHVMWLAHLDLVLAGQREAVLINPVPREAGPRQGEKGAKGWMPRYSVGGVVRDGDAIWLVPTEINTLDLDAVVDWSTRRPSQVEDKRDIVSDVEEDAVEAARALLRRHLAETTEMLKALE